MWVLEVNETLILMNQMRRGILEIKVKIAPAISTTFFRLLTLVARTGIDTSEDSA